MTDICTPTYKSEALILTTSFSDIKNDIYDVNRPIVVCAGYSS